MSASAMDLSIDLQLASDLPDLPGESDLSRWAQAALQRRRGRAEITIRLVDEAESRALNLRWRGLDRPTNVLSFPFELPPGIDSSDPIADLLGDLVLCAPLVRREALEQGKQTAAHWAHLVIHGVLHLQGFDHQSDEEAETMESLETVILTGLGFPPPYEERTDTP